MSKPSGGSSLAEPVPFETTQDVLRTVLGGGSFEQAVLRTLPAAIYATDAAGRITFFNDAAAEFWGCRPELGESTFCGSWKLYWPDGKPMAYDECPMAIALKTQKADWGNDDAIVSKNLDGIIRGRGAALWLHGLGDHRQIHTDHNPDLSPRRGARHSFAHPQRRAH